MVNLTINGTTYAFPATGDESWGDVATNWATAVTNGMLQKAGGLFTLTGDANFGPNFGLTALYFKTRNNGASLGTSTVASTGQFRLATLESISWRNNANSADLSLATSASDRLQFGAVNIPTISSTDTLTNKTISGSSNTLSSIAYSSLVLAGSIVNADIATGAAIAYSKLALAGSVATTDLAAIATNTLIGNNTGGSAVPVALTVAQVNTMLGSLSNPMTTTGDVIYGVGSTPTRLAGNTTTTKKFLTQTGNGSVSAAPAWGTLAAADMPFTAPTIQKFTSGSGTYTTPAGVRYIRVRLVGGGGGGSGSALTANNNGGVGGGGGNTTFGTSLLVGNGGAGAAGAGNNPGGTGGSASLGTGPIGVALTGGQGGQSSTVSAGYAISGLGASSPFGGNGSSGGGAQAGTAAAANTGSGGGGAGSPNTGQSGGGGGAGGFVDAIITSPLASYAYAVGAAGSGGAAGTSGFVGGNGGAGIIIVEEYY